MAVYAYYCFLKFGMLPSTFVNLPFSEMAFVIACIDKKIEADREEERRMKKKR